jgi:hypothetical protein
MVHHNDHPEHVNEPAPYCWTIEEGLVAGKECFEAALGYLARGWSVTSCCPPDHVGVGRVSRRHSKVCKSPGKRPWHTWVEYQKRLATEAEVREWWRLLPNANVGAALGISGVVRVDGDGDGGAAKLRELCGGDPPRTLEFTSGQPGSLGLLYAVPPGVKLQTKSEPFRLGRHNELRLQGPGAQTVLPPSRHRKGGRYRWLAGRGPGEIEAAPMPPWMIDMMRLRERNQSVSAGHAAEGADPADIALALAALAGLSEGRAGDYDTWLHVGMALHAVSDGDVLLEAWNKWSKHCEDKFAEGACAEKWATFDRQRQEGVGLGSLVFWAKSDGWTPPPRPGVPGRDGAPPAPDTPATGPADDNHQQEDPSAPPGEQVLISNGIKVERQVVPYPMSVVVDNIRTRLDDWPRRIGTSLFVPAATEGISWIESAAALFGYLGTQTGTVKWFKATGCVTKEEVYAELRRTAPAYDAVETLPHSPQLSGHFYACPTPEPGSGETLKRLVGRFRPATDIDRDLIQAAIVTAVVWGGRGGCRPAFTVTSDAGRGTGKSTLPKMVGHLAGGLVDLSANESAEVIKQRLLSPDGLVKRVVLLDNVKTLRFSWAELEALITSPVVSGKRLYIGEASRPNTMAWFITLNGVSLAADMAQRSVIIKLNKPEHSATWEEDTYAYIDANRRALVADCLGFFRREPAEVKKYSRWGAWERDVLSRLPDPENAQGVIRERQGQADVEQEEHELVEEFFERRLKELGYEPAGERVFIPSLIAADWFSAATRTKQTTTGASRILNQAIAEGKLQRIVENACKTYGRGFVWVGKDTRPDTPALTDLESVMKDHASGVQNPFPKAAY